MIILEGEKWRGGEVIDDVNSGLEVGGGQSKEWEDSFFFSRKKIISFLKNNFKDDIYHKKCLEIKIMDFCGL